jgi:hypothetical protein
MVVSDLRLIRRSAEFRPRSEVDLAPHGKRGIYVLLKYGPKNRRNFDVVYVGMAAGPRGGLRRRLKNHARKKGERGLWTHFSAFEVWDNIRGEEIQELEGLSRHIYRKDRRANRLNRQRTFKKLIRVREEYPLFPNC